MSENRLNIVQREISSSQSREIIKMKNERIKQKVMEVIQERTEDIKIVEDKNAEEISVNDKRGYIVCIDPGHQRKGNYNKEPIGPGASTLKAKVSSGTRGVSTKVPEYKLNLEVSLLLKEKLKNEGYTVVMTRETNDVDISNKERAEMANNANVFLRIHADSSSSSKTQGIHTLCPAKDSQYTKDIYEESNRLSKTILKELVTSIGAKSKGISYRKDISGFNWSKVPVVLIEMGFMTNPEEDKKLSTREYQDKIVDGIVNGINTYFRSMD